MSNENIAAQIGKAWRYEREGKTQEAISEYERILKQNGDDIDANFGMGLAQRAAGHKDRAVEFFQRAADLSEAALKRSRQQTSTSEGHLIHSIGNTPEDDRNMMVNRMAKQRIAEIKAGLK